MSVVAPQENLQQQECLQQIAQRLQARLLHQSSAVPFQVQCVLRSGNLMVLGEHPPAESLLPEQIFGLLEQEIRALLPAVSPELFVVAVPETVQVKLFLRSLGQAKPYAFHGLNLVADRWVPPQEADAVIVTDVTDVTDTPIVTAEPTINEPMINEPTTAEPSVDEITASRIEASLDREGALPEDATPTLNDSLELDESFVASLAPTETVATAHDEADETLAAKERSPLLFWAAMGIGVSVVSFAAGLLVVSNTCVIGKCAPMQMAAALNQEVDDTIKMAQSGQDLQQAQQRLNAANRLLGSIPPWSMQRGEAQMLLKRNQTEAALLDQALLAEQQAGEASQKSQTVPQTAGAWQSIQVQWRDAIAQIQRIPQGTELFPFAQNRLTIYRANLKTVDRYLAAERQAQKKLATAKAAANVAEVRQNVAQTLENWQQVQSSWQTVVNSLQQIPTTTTSHAEAQQLLTNYTAKLATARDRATRELMAKNSYGQAIALAQTATNLQGRNQWTQATATWQKALNAVEQVPAGTSYSAKAQPLIATYSASFNRAETQLQVVVKQQKVRDDLKRVCAGSPKTCNYLIRNDRIRVQFTAAYEQALRQAFSVGQAGNNMILGGAVHHVDSLQAALQAISTNAGVPLDVYNASGSEVLASFNPGG